MLNLGSTFLDFHARAGLPDSGGTFRCIPLFQEVLFKYYPTKNPNPPQKKRTHLSWLCTNSKQWLKAESLGDQSNINTWQFEASNMLWDFLFHTKTWNHGIVWQAFRFVQKSIQGYYPKTMKPPTKNENTKYQWSGLFANILIYRLILSIWWFPNTANCPKQIKTGHSMNFRKPSHQGVRPWSKSQAQVLGTRPTRWTWPIWPDLWQELLQCHVILSSTQWSVVQPYWGWLLNTGRC